MERPMRMKASSVKIFVSDIYVFQETCIMEENLNNQVNKMTWPISVIGHAKQWTSEWSDRRGRHRGYMGPAAQTPLNQADLATIICKCPVCHQKTPVLIFEYGNKPRDSKLMTGGSFHPRRARSFVLTGTDTYSRYGFALLCLRASARTI